MTYNWNKADVVKIGARNRKPIITLRNSGGVHLNSGFIREYNLQNKAYVKALIIKEDKKIIIGLIFLEKKENDTLSLAWGREKKNAGFSGRSIFTEAGFDFKKRTPISFEPKIEDYANDKIFIIEIKKEGDKIGKN